MRMAARIQRIRLERSMTLEDVETTTGLTKTFMARLEKGREVPTLEMLDTLAGVLNVPVHMFFFDAPEPASMPRLAPRAALQELAEEWQGPATFRTSPHAGHQRDARGGSWRRRINSGLRLVVASFFASFR
jgi:transcriptional regulator with XRE-family HTH domain